MPDITPSILVAASTAPSSPSDLWAPASVFPANWTNLVRLSSRWQTDVGSAQSLAEKRMALVNRPSRVITVDLLASGHARVSDLQDLLMRLGHARSVFPVYSDQALLTNPSPTTTLSGNFALKRFYAGARILLLNRKTPAFEIALLQTVTTTQLTLTQALSGTFPVGTFIFPLIEAEVTLDSPLSYETDQVATASVQASETVGASALPWIGDTYGSYPTLTILPNWSELTGNVQRVGSYSLVGRASVLQYYGSRPLHQYRLDFAFTTRLSAWEFISFFDSRKGRALPFWMPSPLSEYVALDIDTTTITLALQGQELDWSFRPYLAIVLKDGTHLIREIANVARDTGEATDTITFTESIPSVLLTDIRRVCLASLMRFDTDELTEEWISDSCMKATVSLVELLEEHEVNSLEDTSGLTWIDVDDLAELQAMRFDVHKNYRLTGDIDATPTEEWNHNGSYYEGFIPIGTESLPFLGRLDGQGYTVTGLFINRPDEDFQGLFGLTDAGARISNLNLADTYVRGINNSGPLAGQSFARVDNCHSSACDVVGTGDDIGGLAGDNDGIIINSSSSGEVHGVTDVGGLAGDNDNVIINCHSSCNVYCSVLGDAGGLVGDNKGFKVDTALDIRPARGIVVRCYATGNIASENSSPGSTPAGDGGGLVGDNRGGQVWDSWASGNISGLWLDMGGIAGSNKEADTWTGLTPAQQKAAENPREYRSSIICRCSYRGGTITPTTDMSSDGATELGLIAGDNKGGTIRECVAVGVIVNGNLRGNRGPVCGDLSDGGEVSRTYYVNSWAGSGTTPTNTEGISKTIAQLYQETTYTDWDFTNVWGIDEGTGLPFVLDNLTETETFDETDIDINPTNDFAMLLTFKYGTTTVRRAAYTSNVIVGSDTYTALPAASVQFDKLHGGAEAVKVSITMPKSESPVNTLARPYPHPIVQVTVAEIDPSDTATLRQLFVGEITHVKVSSRSQNQVVVLEAYDMRAKLDVPLGIQANTTCIWGFGDMHCEVDTDALEVVTTISALDQQVLTVAASVTTRLRFSRGWVEKDGLRIFIREAAYNVFQLVRLPPPEWAISNSVTILPGCDKTINDCRDKWANEARFCGCGYGMPSYNPAMIRGNG